MSGGAHLERARRGATEFTVIRTSNGDIRWMNVSDYLREKSKGRKTHVRQIVFDGEPFTALNLQLMRDRLVGPPA